MPLRCIEPLKSVITVDGELRTGFVEVDGCQMRVECAVDGAWAYLYQDEQCDFLARYEDGSLRSTEPSITAHWTAEDFAALQQCINQTEPSQPVAFIRRPPQGFEIPPAQPTNRPQTSAPNRRPASPQARPPEPERTPLQMAIFGFFFFLCFLFGIIFIQDRDIVAQQIGGGCLFAAIGGFYHVFKYVFMPRKHPKKQV